MPKPFLYQAKNPDGRLVVDYVEAPSLADAKVLLEQRGLSEVVFVTDENAAIYEHAAAAGSGMEDDVSEFSARDWLASTQRKGVAAHLWWLAKQHLVPVALLATWNLSSWFDDRPFGWGDWCGFIVSVLYGLYAIIISLPLMLYQGILDAMVRCDHGGLRRLVRIARWHRRVSFVGLPPSELDFREAGSLAAEGKLEEALALVERWRGDPAMADALFLSRVATLYDYSGDYPKLVALMEESAALNTNDPSAWLDVAAARIRRLRDIEGAKAALARVGDVELAALACAFRNSVEGVIAVESGADEEAIRVFTGVIEDLSVFGLPIIAISISEAHAYMVLSLARLGRREEARVHFAAAEPLLKLHRADDLYPRCMAAIRALDEAPRGPGTEAVKR